ncbi:TrbI/VirB10 family protein [Neisseria gonorrhoeae]
MRVKVNKFKLSAARKRQLAIAGMVAGSMAAIVGSAIYVIEGNKKKSAEVTQVQNKRQILRTDFTSPQAGITDNSLWMNTESSKIEYANRKISELETMVQELKEKENSSNPDTSKGLGPDGLGKPPAISGIGDNSRLPPAPPAGTLPNGAPPADRPIERKIVSGSMSEAELQPGTTGSVNTGNPNENVRVSPQLKEAEWVKSKTPRMNIEVVEDGGKVVVSQGKFRARDSYIPSGTFFRSVLLGGVDAPTGGEAQNASPHPVLMRVTDFAQLPNRFKYNFRECFVTGQAYGDISSERAYIRLQNLSCVGTDGRAIDMPVKGYVAGEDGKTGVRGNLVTKQGQLLANALMSGVISGMGKGVSEAFKVTNNTAFGSTTSIRGSDQYRAGIASGIGGAADRLAEYYIKLADKVFPVVEVNAGRQVDVVLTQGIEIDTGETK